MTPTVKMTEVFDRAAMLESAGEIRGSTLYWDRNDPPAPSILRIGLVSGILIAIGLISLTMSYYGPNTSPVWTARFDRLELRDVPPGTGYIIEVIRLVAFVFLTVFVVGTRFTSSIRAFFNPYIWSPSLILSRLITTVTLVFFVIAESRRHLDLSRAPSGMVEWAAQHHMSTTPELEAASYQWYLAYSLINYLVILGGLFAFPFVRFWFSDLSYIQRQTKRFEAVQRETTSAEVAALNLRRYEHECRYLTKRYIDLLGVLCFGIHYEYWLGQLTLSNAGTQTAAMAWFVVAFASVFLIAIAAVYARGLSTSEEVIVRLLHAEANDNAIELSVVNFLRRMLTSNLGGVAMMSIAIIAIHTSISPESRHKPLYAFAPATSRSLEVELTDGSEFQQRGDRRISPIIADRVNRLADLYVLSIGISEYKEPKFNLSVAHNDAVTIASTFQGLEGQLFDHVKTDTLTNQDATKDALLTKLEWLQSQVTQNDLAIISISAHGTTDRFNDYFLLPHDYDPNGSLGFSAVSWDDINRWLRRMPCTVWLIMDTCHSGRVTELGMRDIQQDQMERATEKAISTFVGSPTGIVIMAASLSQQTAQEKSNWGHGALTLALLEGITGKRFDNPKASTLQYLPTEDDGILSLGELSFYATKRVKELTGGQQAIVTNHTGNINIDQIPICVAGSN